MPQVDVDAVREAAERRSRGGGVGSVKDAARRRRPSSGGGGFGTTPVPGQEASGGGGPSLVQQIPGAVFDTGKALATGLLPAAWDSTVGNVGGAIQNVAFRQDADEIRNRKGPLGTLGRLFANESMVEAASSGRPFSESFDAAAPILTEPAKSFAQTGRNIADLAQVPFTDKGFEDTTLSQASDEGQTVNWLLENVGNVLFAGRLASGGAASAASRAGASAPRLQRAAQVARRADDALDRTLLAPITYPVKGVAGAARALARSETGRKFSASPLGQELSRLQLTPKTRRLSDLQHKYQVIEAIRREDEAASPAKRVQSILSGVDEGATRRTRRPPETVRAAEGAMILGAMDMGPMARALDTIRRTDEDAFVAAVNDLADEFDNPTFTPEAMGMFIDEIKGDLDPALADAIDRARTEWVERANKGGLVRNVDGTEVVTGSEPNYLAGTGRLFDTAEGPAQRAESLTARERVFDNVDPESPLSVDARYRNTVQLMRAGDRAIANLANRFDLPEGVVAEARASIPTAIDDILEQTNPEWVRSGRTPEGAGVSRRNPKARKVQSEFAKQGGRVPLDVDTQAALGAADVRRQVTNEMLKEARQQFGIDPVAKYPDLEDIDGRQLIEEVSEREGEPYVAWDPSRLFEQDESGIGLSKGESMQVKPDQTPAGARLVPKYVADAFDYAFSQQNKAAQILIDKPTRLFKAAVLPLNSPRWLTGNTISGVVMAHAAKVTPVDIAKYFRRTRKAMKDYAQGRRSEVPREVLGIGHSASERRLFDQFADSLDNVVDADELAPRRAQGRVGRAIGGAVRAGYDINTWTDDMFRSIVTLKKLDEGVPVQQAVREAQTALGNFDRLTPFERRVVRRAFPFYAWVKHITRLSTKLAIDDPARVSWNMGIPLVFSREDQNVEGPSWLEGMIGLGDDEFLSIGWAFPYATTAEFNPANPLEAVGGMLNPVLTTVYTLGTGNDVDFGRFEPLSTPGTPYGRSPGPPIFTNPQSVPYLIGRNIPQFQAVYDELQRQRSGGEGQRLFDTGERIGRTDPNKNLEDNLARLFGVPIPKTYTTG